MWQQDPSSSATQIVFRICDLSISSYTFFIPKKAPQCSHKNDGAPRSSGSKIVPTKKGIGGQGCKKMKGMLRYHEE
jgi:hypothetical protein